jgi:hypothetical protein
MSTVYLYAVNDDREKYATRPMRVDGWMMKQNTAMPLTSSSHEHVGVLHALDVPASHGLLDIGQELLPILAHLYCCLCNVVVVSRREGSERYAHAPLFRGSSAFGSKNRYCRPTMTEFRLSTGFQSSRRMFRHTLPSKSTLGW